MRRLEAQRLLDALRREAGVLLEISGALEGGQVGAARVRWPDGREGVLKLHGPLRRFGADTAELEARIARVGGERGSEAEYEGTLPGDDVVHQDFHPGNMLSLDGKVTGVIDWDGAGRGDAGFDLVTLRFGIHPAGAPRAVVERLDAMPPDVLRLAWAHMSLRMTDWAIRHFPSDEVGTWVALARQRL